ncbi:MAG TPA: site-specific DNA-methyltransferase [Gemmataceae bacterium]|nr:site-specific DNA-methyltransferase [Gemmataceae bacterium]
MQSKSLFHGLSTIDLAPFGINGKPVPCFRTAMGALFRGDVLRILPAIANECVDTVFADPPFNLGKDYGGQVNDRLEDSDYLDWCHHWIDQCVRVLKPGGAFFLYNLPKWNIPLGHYLGTMGMQFRHWIAISIKMLLPIPGRLYPAHYSLLYYTKGKPKTFRRIRTPIETCRHCGGEVKDYGGHRDAMNEKGVNLMDVWTDIPPVRHWKFKSKKRQANALSSKMLDRVVEMSTRENEVVLDPFGGSGTTFAVCERKCRRWLGIEIESTEVIAERLASDDLLCHRNSDFIEG